MPANGEGRLKQQLGGRGMSLPRPPRPLGHYEVAVQSGPWLFLSGMLPLENGSPIIGRVGEDLTLEQGQAAARLAALNALAAAEEALGSLDRLRRLVRATVTMRTSQAFAAHARIADGASDVFAALFAEGHTRVVLGAETLPMGAAILLDLIFEVRPDPGSSIGVDRSATW